MPYCSVREHSGERTFCCMITPNDNPLIIIAIVNTGVIFCGRVPWLYQYWPGGFMLFVVLCPGTPEGVIFSILFL